MLSLGPKPSLAAGYLAVPGVEAEAGSDSIRIQLGEQVLTYVAGLGWLSNPLAPPPLLTAEGVFLPEAIVEQLAPDVPRVTGIRVGGSEEVRVVLDIPDISDPGILERLQFERELSAGEVIHIELPPLLVPLEQPDPVRGVDVSLLPSKNGTVLELSVPAARVRVFSLTSPNRLVIDVTPLLLEPVRESSTLLRPGVNYRVVAGATPLGESRVHVLEIDPAAGEFRVVGESGEPRTLSQLAAGAFAGINAGYFDTENFGAIGLLRVDYALESLPSRKRASIGFGDASAHMGRVAASVVLRRNGRPYLRQQLTGAAPLAILTTPGKLVGAPDKGVLTVSAGMVLANRVGPAAVPADGYAVVYQPNVRSLALIDTGEKLSYELEFTPSDFDFDRYAVEAGPLLIDEGRPAYQPELESFMPNQRILEAYTQQAAVGLRPDGTVLLVVAEVMRAQDLIPLFEKLGAEQAMRLDSGSSATLLADGRVLNRTRERRVVSAIVFVPHGSN